MLLKFYSKNRENARRLLKKWHRNEKHWLLTIGHSTRAIEEFVRLFKAHAVTQLIDVRTVPRSRHNPQFNRETLPASLENAGIAYLHMPELGGLRRATSDSVNTGWQNASFRGHADYMQTPEFRAAIERLIRLVSQGQIAVMCAEAVPWRCHRSLIADDGSRIFYPKATSKGEAH